MKKHLALSVAMALFAAAPLAAQSTTCDASGTTAQTCTLSVPVDVTVEHVLHLDVSETVTHFGSVGVDGFTAGPTIGVVANTDWDLKIASATPTFLRNGQASTKSISTLFTYRDGNYTEMSTTGFTLSSGTAGFQTVPAFQYYVYTDVVNDVPGDYSAEIVFTLVGK
jgi:hypothetical protein